MTPKALDRSADPEARPIPPLESGDHLTRDEFERRYEAMPELKKAELIEGVVYVPSPTRAKQHSSPHAKFMTWLGNYEASTPGVEALDNATVRLGSENEPQPDGALRVVPEHGGRSRTSEDDYVEGPPELAVEVAASSASYDLHEKLRAFERHGILEYVVYRVREKAIDWFRLVDGTYQRLEPDPAGVYRSLVFPGLWLDARAMIRRDLPRVLEALSEGLKTAHPHPHGHGRA
ncbi:MAG: Uma2 family endonuclease [Planctomycetes bacterium]|nr:Uma2 family endonuclease [Planctomycetota bacterium]